MNADSQIEQQRMLIGSCLRQNTGRLVDQSTGTAALGSPLDRITQESP